MIKSLQQLEEDVVLYKRHVMDLSRLDSLEKEVLSRITIVSKKNPTFRQRIRNVIKRWRTYDNVESNQLVGRGGVLHRP